MQEIKKSEESWVELSWERKKSNQNMGDLFRGLSNFLYIPAFTVIKDFHNAGSWKITQRYKFPQELSDRRVPYSFPQKPNTRTRKLISRPQAPTTWNTMRTTKDQDS